MTPKSLLQRYGGSVGATLLVVGGLCLGLAPGASGASPTCTPAPSGLVSWWRAESNALDSVDSNHGTLMNGVTFATGEVGQAFSLNGTNRYISIPDSPSLRPANLTVEGWFNFTITGGGFRHLVAKTSGPGTYDSFAVWYDSGALYASICTASGQGPYLICAWTPVLGTWHHVAYTFDNNAGTQVLYLDGVAVASGAVSGPIVYDNHPLLIGADINYESPGYMLNGLIDEVSLYNRALSAAEIQAIYAAVGAGKCQPPPPPACVPSPSGLVSWWRAEGSANDSAGTNNGVLLNGAGFDAGKAGQAFLLGGTSSYVEVPDSPTLRLTNALTIEFWAKRLTLGLHYIVEKGGDYSEGQTDFGVVLNDTHTCGSTLMFNFANGWRGCALTPDFAWHHYAIVAQSGQVDPVLYVDGVQQAITARSDSSAMRMNPSTAPLHIGAQIDPVWTYFSQTMVDEVSLYNRALSAAEIATIYKADGTGKCVPMTPPPTSTPAPSGLVSWWPAEGNGNDVGGINNGALLNGVTFTAGKVGQAFCLNGTNQYVSIPDSPSLRPTNLTVEGWVNLSASAAVWVFAIKPYGSGTADSFAVWYENGLLHGGINAPNALPPSLAYTWTPVLGTWHHIAYTFDAGSATHVLYLDGAMVAAGSVTGPIVYDNHPMLVGADIESGSPAYFVNGLLDEVSLYNRALTAAEIAAIYNADGAGKCGIPPSIAVQPLSQTVTVSSNATFTVSATGTVPLSYQWQFNSNSIAGATNSSLTLSNVQPWNIGNYRVVVTNAIGSATSSNATLSIPGVPTNIWQGLVAYYPFTGNANDVSGNGNNGTLAGAAAFGVDRFGNSNQSLSLPGTAGTGSGVDIPLLASLPYVPVTYSAWFQLKAYPPFPQSGAVVMTLMGREQCGDAYEGAICILSHPGDTTNDLRYYTGLDAHTSRWTPPLGAWCQVVLTIDTNGTPNWYINGTNMPGAAGALFNATASQPLGFRIGASGSGGCGGLNRYTWNGLIDDVRVYNRVLSAAEAQQLYAYEAPPVPSVPPAIVTQPQSLTVTAGSNATFSVTATGTAPLSYQWQFNSNGIAGATNSSLTLSNVQPWNIGNYRVVVTNAIGSETSSNATLSIPGVPTNLWQGLVAYYPFTGNANDVSGNGNNGTMKGATTLGVDRFGNSNQSLSLPGTAGTGSGVDIPSLASLPYVPVTYSAWFQLKAYPPFPQSGAVVMTLVGREQCGDAYDGAICAYQEVNGFTNVFRYFTGANGNYAQTPPPTNQWCQVVMTIDTNGTANWYFNGTNVPSSAAPGFSPGSSQPLGFRIGASGSGGCDGTGRYVWNGQIDDVRIYNRVLSAAEAQQLYAYETPPVALSIVSQPQSLTVSAGSNATFSVTAAGTLPLGYQWQFNSNGIAGATNSSLTLTNVASTNAGNYRVVVTNAFGSVTSSNAVLSVGPLPVITVQPRSQAAVAGTNVSLSVSVDAVLPAVNSGTLRLWLKGDAGVITNSAGQVSQWRDQSGNTNHASQSNTNLQPLLVYPAALNGRAAVRFDGIQVTGQGDYLHGMGDVSIPDGYTSFMVYLLSNNTNNEIIPAAVGIPPIYGTVRIYGIAAQTMWFSSWTYDVSTDFVVPTNTYRIWTDRLNTNRTIVELFDSTATTGTNFVRSISGLSAPAPGYYVGGLDPAVQYVVSGRNFGGDIAELMYFRGSLTEGDRLAVEQYLKQKYYQAAAAGVTYQWRLNGTNIAGATNAMLTLTNVQSGQAGSYSVIVGNAFGSVTSSNAVLSVGPLPVITVQPQSQTVAAGTNVSFNVGVFTDPVLPAVNSGTLRLWLKGDAGVITNSAGQVSQWQDQSGNTNHASQANTNQQPLLVHPPVIGGRAALRFDGIQDNVTGDYLRGTGDVGIPDAFTSFLVHYVSNEGNTERMPVLVGVPGVVYGASRAYDIANQQWWFTAWTYQHNTGFIVPTNTYRIWTSRMNTSRSLVDLFDSTATDSTNFSFAMSGLSAPAAGYYVGGLDPTVLYVATGRNFGGDIAELMYFRGSLTEGDRLAVEQYLKQKYYQAAAPAVAYQWRFNGTNIAGATNATLTLTNVQSGQAGNYSVIVGNAFGSVTSSNAVLTVTSPAISAMTRQSNGNVLLQFAGVSGVTYVVEASTNLLDWEAIGTCTDKGDGFFGFEDADATKFPSRFYRVVAP
jgi:hypothetical protein